MDNNLNSSNELKMADSVNIDGTENSRNTNGIPSVAAATDGKNITINPQDRIENKKESKLVDELLDWAESFVFSLFIMLLIMMFAFKLVEVEGDSMEGTLSNSDRILVSNLFGAPKQGDIVVVNSKGLNKTIVKRCIAVEGQVVEIDYNADTIKVDGKVIEEDYLSTFAKDMRNLMLFDTKYFDASASVYRYTVPDNCIFVLGDNRNNSTDSRFSSVAFVSIDDVLGKALVRIYPFNKFGKV